MNIDVTALLDAPGDAYNGIVSKGEIGMLLKSLSAGADSTIAEAAAAGNTSGFALRPQSLEKTLTITTFKDEHIVFWKDLQREKAQSTVEEYNVLESYGDEVISASMLEGELPVSEDSVYLRNLMKIKFMGTLRSVTDVFGIVAVANGDAVARETTNGFTWLNRQMERALFFADSDVIPTDFDGFKKMMELGSAQVYDGRSSTEANAGGTFTKDLIDEIAEVVFSQYFGRIDRVYYSTAAHRKFGHTLGLENATGDSNARLDLAAVKAQGNEIVAGFRMNRFASLFGDWQLKPDIFLNPPGYTATQLTGARFAKGSAKPATPVIDQEPTLGANGAGKWGTIAALQYKYAFVAVSPKGNSIAIISNAATLDDATKQLQSKFKTGNGGDSTTTGFIVYRTAPHAAASYAAGTTKYYEIARVKAASADGSTVNTFNDINSVIAGTSWAFCMTSADDTYTWKNLAPAMKIPLAKIDLRTRWAQVIYGAPILRAPKKCVLVKNLA